MASISNLFSVLMEEAPNYALKLAPSITKAGKESVEYIQKAIKLANIKAKLASEDKLIDNYFKKIGKTFYEQKLTTTNSAIKENVSKIKSLEVEKEKKNKQVAILEKELKTIIPNIKKIIPSIPSIKKNSKSKKVTSNKAYSKTKKTSSKKK